MNLVDIQFFFKINLFFYFTFTFFTLLLLFTLHESLFNFAFGSKNSIMIIVDIIMFKHEHNIATEPHDKRWCTCT